MPPEKNCLRFAEALKSAGGDIEVVARSLFGHHPHGLEIDEQQKFVDFFNGASSRPAPSHTLVAATGVAAQDVTLENARFRLVLSGDGHAKSLVVKATGEEMLEAGACVPFSTITQNRAYDNEFKLMYAAKPWTLPASSVERRGDELRIRYRDEFFTAVVKVETTDSYIGLRLLRFDYELEASGFKRKTEIDSFALAQLPVKRRRHFGQTLNVTWDERGCLALMAARPETRIDAFERESGGDRRR